MISIIVPVYNVEKYVLRCLESIKHQTYGDFEVIIVNDGSQDGSAAVCEKVCGEDRRFRMICQKNGGLSAARNTGLEIASGDYLMFVDSDDYIHPQMCEILLQQSVYYNADISICGFRKVDEKETVNMQELSVKDGVSEIYTGVESCYNIYKKRSVESVVAWNKLYRKELFADLRYPVGKIHEDEFVAYKLLYLANKVVYTTSELYFYVQRAGSIMQGVYDDRHLVILEMAQESVSFYREKGQDELMTLAIGRAFGLAGMLYENYRQIGDKTNQRRVLKVYRAMAHEYLPCVEWGRRDKTEIKIYGRSPYLSKRYHQAVDFRSRIVGKLSRMFR